MTNLLEEIVFQGHPLVRALHPSTMELTKERDLTQRGDCVIGVSADKAAFDLSSAVKEALRTAGASVTFTIRVGGERFVFTARGSRGLLLDDRRDVVIRRSQFISPRTLAIDAEAAARDIPRALVDRLREGERGLLTLQVNFA
jgi:hypothetical protein